MLGSRRLKGSKKREHHRDCESLLMKLDPALASVQFEGYLRNYCDYEGEDRCLQYKPDKIRLDKISQTLRLCLRCGKKNCVIHSSHSCALM